MHKLLFLLLIGLGLNAQSNTSFRLYLKDKGSNIELLESPEEFLSKEAIARRKLQGIEIGKSDLPIAPEYRQAVKELNAEILAHSRWFNYLYLQHPNPEIFAELPFVERIEFPENHSSHLSKLSSADSLDYGFGRGQIRMLNGDKLHLEGYTGKGVTIAVIDAGFYGLHQAPSMDSLLQSGRLLGTHNFISGDTNVFGGYGSHGNSVLSIMAANHPDTLVGTAPHANYWLFTTEDISQETPIEMDYWLMAAEFADSVGAHIINTSVSYTTFDNSQNNFSYSDLDGNTTLITKAADKAASKGILVVSSAGNNGDQAWQYIGAPADGDSVLSVGAVSYLGDYAQFSSRGPSFDGRVKPDVAAQGSPTTLVDGTGIVSFDFGTSYSAPLIAGLAACLMEAYPAKEGEEIADYIRQSAHLYTSPNDSLGYGIPNFELALSLSKPKFIMADEEFKVYPNPALDHLIIDAQKNTEWQATLMIFDLNGRLVQQEQIEAFNAYRLNINLEPGLYQIALSGDLNGTFKIWLK